MELRLDTLTKTYGKKKAVHNVTASLTPGIYGILGPNGAGKTTLINMVCGILRPNDGTVLFDGKEISLLGEKYRTVLGFLPQNFGYYRDFTVRRFLSYIAYLKGLDSSTAQERIRCTLETMSLSDTIDNRLSQLSGGMRQRVGISQALLNDPDVLILDEPTAGLDPAERVKFRNLIGTISQDKITLLSTHIVSDVAYIADRLLVINNGSIIYQGTVKGFTEKVQGWVWEIITDVPKAERIATQHTISKLYHTPQGVCLRLLSESCPFEGAQPASPDLEDAYLFYTGQKGGDEHEV